MYDGKNYTNGKTAKCKQENNKNKEKIIDELDAL